MNPGLLLGAAAAAIFLLSRKKEPRTGDGGQGAPAPRRPGIDYAVGGLGGSGGGGGTGDGTSVSGVPGSEPGAGGVSGQFKPLPEPQVLKFEGTMSPGTHTLSLGPVPKNMRTFVKVYFQVVLDKKPNQPHQGLDISRVLDINPAGNDMDPNEPYDVVLKNDTLSDHEEFFMKSIGEEIQLPGWNGEFFNLFNPRLKVFSGVLRLEYDGLYVNGNSHNVINVGVTYTYA